jgi:hypothetical protein
MRDYRLYFRTLDTNQAITRVELIEAADDRDARVEALRHSGNYTMELWSEKRKVASFGPDGVDLIREPVSHMLWACIAEGRSPTPDELENVVTKTIREAFHGASSLEARKNAIRLADAAFHGRKGAARRAA